MAAAHVTPTPPLPSLPHCDLNAWRAPPTSHLFGVMATDEDGITGGVLIQEASPGSPAVEACPSEAVALWALINQVRTRDVDAARKVHCLTQTSTRHRCMLNAAIEPLVAMLRSAVPFFLSLLLST